MQSVMNTELVVLVLGLAICDALAADVRVVWRGDGTFINRQNLGARGRTYSSMAFVGPYPYASSTEGETVVIEPGREYKKVARNRLEPFAS